MDEVVEWLKSLGLAEYAPRFIENQIDASLLSDLTDQFLKEIGVGPVGHRMKMLRAVAARAAAVAECRPRRIDPVSGRTLC